MTRRRLYHGFTTDITWLIYMSQTVDIPTLAMGGYDAAELPWLPRSSANIRVPCVAHGDSEPEPPA